MATQNWVNIGSGNGLVPDGTKPLPEPMLTNHQMTISHEMLKIAILDLSLKIINLNIRVHLPGINELTNLLTSVTNDDG